MRGDDTARFEDAANVVNVIVVILHYVRKQPALCNKQTQTSIYKHIFNYLISQKQQPYTN